MDRASGSSVTIAVQVCGAETGAQFMDETFCLPVSYIPVLRYRHDL